MKEAYNYHFIYLIDIFFNLFIFTNIYESDIAKKIILYIIFKIVRYLHLQRLINRY